ncbi:5-oxo-L-prolinase [Kushneria phosphatilytica]|uniref:Amidohydrolase family protein n=2 Tax=Kushneria phosphatilytica TaxID=657387 RepID=A0A1S1NZN1_9GAMM|nr:5-oxo-L-prolinase [Kushneria phosphatilytica]QEL12774.1 amidohydrolase family protein [Kushneria phosphatilytica]
MLVFLIGLLGNAVPSTAASERYTDSHLHYVDFFQRSDGLKALLEAMDHAGVGRAQLMGLAVNRKWSTQSSHPPRALDGDEPVLYWYSATDYRLAAELSRVSPEVRQRFYPFISGFNPTDRHASEQIAQLLALYPGLWRGIGEILTRHDRLSQLTEGEPARADHPALMAVYALAGRHHLPVLLHSNIASMEAASPRYLPELERALAEHPGTTFIWAHAGTSEMLNRQHGRLAWLNATVAQLLARYPNLYVDLSWSVLHPYLLDQQGEAREPWVALVERYPTRFMLGSDLVGHFAPMSRMLNGFRPFLDALEETTSQRVAQDNFLALMGESPASDNDPVTP